MVISKGFTICIIFFALIALFPHLREISAEFGVHGVVADAEVHGWVEGAEEVQFFALELLCGEVEKVEVIVDPGIELGFVFAGELVGAARDVGAVQ